MSSSSLSRCNAKENSNPFESPEAKKKKEDYEDYDLSPPPKLRERDQREFEDAVDAIQGDFKDILRLEWVDDEKVLDDKKVLKWFKKRSDGTETELPMEFCRILLFLYSRNFKKNVGQEDRRAAVRVMMSKGNIRKIIRQVINCGGDNDLSLQEDYQNHYIRVCLTLFRYFQQAGASGFSQDMSSLTYYLRIQKFGSCFIQAACVVMSYLLQVFGKKKPPPNASRLIRHHFNDEELIKYVTNLGGDSVAIFKHLEKTFFQCDRANRDPDRVISSNLDEQNVHASMKSWLQKGPGLISKFIVPQNFYCLPPSDALRRKFPELDEYVAQLDKDKDIWQKIPAKLIPPGVARFTTWDEPAKFILLDNPTDTALIEQEAELRGRWKKLLNRSTEDDVRSTAVTASLSAESSYDSQPTLSERSTTDNASMFKDDDSVGEAWSDFGEDKDDDGSNASNESNEPKEGDSALHAMVLLGHHIENGTEYWVVQNSWEGPTQIMEFSTDYFMKSGAYIYFYNPACRELKPEHEWETKKLQSFFCPSPVAESGGLERSDCENWTDDLIYSGQKQEQEHELEDDDFFFTLFDD